MPKQPGPSPERAALAEAIRNFARTEKRAAALVQAKETASAAVRAARSRVEEAAAGIDRAAADAAEHMVAMAAGQDHAAPPSVRSARDALRDCEDELAAALAAKATLETTPVVFVDEPALARMTLKEAALAVLHREQAKAATEAVVEIDALQRRVAMLGGEIEWRVSNGFHPLADHGGLPRDSRIGHALARISTWHDLTAEKAGGRARSETVLAALMRDADAPIPQ